MIIIKIVIAIILGTGKAGVEPTILILEISVLPLNYFPPSYKNGKKKILSN